MKLKFRWILLGLLILALVSGTLSWAWFMDGATDQDLWSLLGLGPRTGPWNHDLPQVGEPALECTFHDLDGHEVRLRELAGHMPALVEFGGFT
jgi:hypothetical protein